MMDKLVRKVFKEILEMTEPLDLRAQQEMMA
jgi:hypothetical protein